MKKKRKIGRVIICVGLLCVIWGGYFLARYYGTERILDIEEDDFSWVYQVDSVKTEGKDFVLQGFAFELDKNAEEGVFEIVLEEIESGERYFPKMEYMDRKDVNEYFLCEYDYIKSGFKATINARKLELHEKSYVVLLRMIDERQTYQTGTYISKGTLIYTNPLEYEPLDVTGTDLEKIVENGVLRVYRPEFGMYVYQYEGELYWIAEPEYGFVEGDTYVQYQLGTTQVERLPQIRLDNQWDWDNIGFIFSAHELSEMDTGRYRVAKGTLPTAYSIKKIWTGNYINSWIWVENFRPYYVFE